MQEALTNIIRHSAATEVIVTMESAKNFFSFRTSDNGKGIPKKKSMILNHSGFSG